MAPICDGYQCPAHWIGSKHVDPGGHSRQRAQMLEEVVSVLSEKPLIGLESAYTERLGGGNIPINRESSHGGLICMRHSGRKGRLVRWTKIILVILVIRDNVSGPHQIESRTQQRVHGRYGIPTHPNPTRFMAADPESAHLHQEW